MENEQQVWQQVEAVLSAIDSLPEQLREEALKKIQAKLGQNKTTRKSGRIAKKSIKVNSSSQSKAGNDQAPQEVVNVNDDNNNNGEDGEETNAVEGVGIGVRVLEGDEEELIKLCESDGIKILHCYSEAPEEENKKKIKAGRNLSKRRKFALQSEEPSSGKPKRRRRPPKKLLEGADELSEDDEDPKSSANEEDTKDETAIQMFKVPSGVKPSQVSVLLEEVKENKEGKRVKGQRTIYGCPICGRKLHSKSMVHVHMRVHTGEKPHKCHICDKAFSQRGALNIHVRRHEKQYSYECEYCEYKSVAKVDLLRHIARHTGEKNYSCEYCGKGFITDSSLKDHLKHVHERLIIHHCHLCDFTTHRADNLKRHRLVKHSNKEYLRCPICEEFIKQRGTFITHLRTHTGERPHSCPVEGCDKSFKSLSQVAAHVRIHKEGMFECSQCNRKFKTKFHLKRHSVVHTGEKPFKCDFCDYYCNVKGNINKHVRLVHGMKDFSFKALQEKAKIKDVSHLGLEEKEANDVLNKGKAIAEEFLKKLSIRKDENLTVEELKRAVELKRSQKPTSVPKTPTKKASKTSKKKIKNSEVTFDDENEVAMTYLKDFQIIQQNDVTGDEEESEEMVTESVEVVEQQDEDEVVEGTLTLVMEGSEGDEKEEGNTAFILPPNAAVICLGGEDEGEIMFAQEAEEGDETQTAQTVYLIRSIASSEQ
ncbi:hypothetical protein CHUAL_000669 [Chamberlinius hualienensis]